MRGRATYSGRRSGWGAGRLLFWWEVLAPGRLAAGERFAFERLRVQTEVYAGARPVLREDYLLEPARKDLAATARMFEYSHTASLCAVQEGRPPAFWRALEDRLNETRARANAERARRLGREHCCRRTE